MESPVLAPLINSPADVVMQVLDMRASKKEHFIALLLNARNRLLHKETISIGTLTASLVHPREVFEPAIRYSAAAVIIVHNHPSGDTEPSDYDISITQRLLKSGELLGIEVLDHIIVTSTDFMSFKSEGLI